MEGGGGRGGEEEGEGGGGERGGGRGGGGGGGGGGGDPRHEGIHLSNISRTLWTNSKNRCFLICSNNFSRYFNIVDSL